MAQSKQRQMSKEPKGIMEMLRENGREIKYDPDYKPTISEVFESAIKATDMMKKNNQKDYPHIKNWLSIKKAKDCLFARRNGHTGKIIFGYSIRLRLFGHDLI